LLLGAAAGAFPLGAAAEQASEPASAAAGQLDLGTHHSCALLGDGSVRCWGFGGDGQLGYGNTNTIGDDETPGSAGPVNLGLGRTARAISAGDSHTCALLDDGSVRCWGFGADGRLGYGNTDNVGDDDAPGSAGPVNLARPAMAITAGAGHTCAVLDDGNVRCWGYGGNGQLGYGNPNSIGDTKTPDTAGPVNLGAGRTATAITASGQHTCALLDNDDVRCWGYGGNGQLGYSSPSPCGSSSCPPPVSIGDTETPDTAGPVNLGLGRTARAISAGDRHTCARLDDDNVRCWGFGGNGQLGYGDMTQIGDNETPDTAGPVNLGAGRTARAISAGAQHTCSRLDDRNVRCWGLGTKGRLGYANTNTIGDTETPDSVGPVSLGRSASAISAGAQHSCALLDDGSVRCWGFGANGRLGYCNEDDVGDDEVPASAGPVDFQAPAGGGSGCAGPDTPPPSGPPPAGGGVRSGGAPGGPAPGPEAAVARRPGRVTGLKARAVSRTKILLSFPAPGTDGPRSAAARAYVVKQSRRPIRGARRFSRAHTLCKGSCRFSPPRVGAKIKLTITDLGPNTTYYYAVAARDNTSNALGPRSKTVRARTR